MENHSHHSRDLDPDFKPQTPIQMYTKKKSLYYYAEINAH